METVLSIAEPFELLDMLTDTDAFGRGVKARLLQSTTVYPAQNGQIDFFDTITRVQIQLQSMMQHQIISRSTRY